MVKEVRAGPPAIIKYDGVYDWPGLYRVIHNWFRERGFETHDKTYKHTAGTIGAEEEHIIYGLIKETEYYKYKISLDIHAWGIHSVEVIKNGKKEKLNKAIVKMVISFVVLYDYQGKFESSPFLEKLRDFYHNHILIDEDNAIVQDKLYYLGYKLHRAIKEHLGLTSDVDAYDKKYW